MSVIGVDRERLSRRGKARWDAARLAIARRCDAGFAGRLSWAPRLQPILTLRGSRGSLLTLAGHYDRLWRAFFFDT